ncbi:hypothetical protein DFH11DRAFT_1046348 [Phellopilus nigrolimitatus]|nr:hypothetical protein DFH11DRAFT_1046348 [Phellopilus nigrolimitatus]
MAMMKNCMPNRATGVAEKPRAPFRDELGVHAVPASLLVTIAANALCTSVSVLLAALVSVAADVGDGCQHALSDDASRPASRRLRVRHHSFSAPKPLTFTCLICMLTVGPPCLAGRRQRHQSEPLPERPSQESPDPDTDNDLAASHQDPHVPPRPAARANVPEKIGSCVSFNPHIRRWGS